MHMNVFHPSFGTIDNPRRDARYVRDKRIRGKNYREAEMKKVSEALAAERAKPGFKLFHSMGDVQHYFGPTSAEHAAAADYFGANAPDTSVKMNEMIAAMAKSSQVNSPSFDAIKDATAIAAQIPRRLLDAPTPAEVDVAVGQACAIYRHVQGETTSERKNRIAREKRAIAKAAKDA